MFLVRTNSSAMKWVASAMEDTTETPSRAKICNEHQNMSENRTFALTNRSSKKKNQMIPSSDA